jgi:hypothetical protein
MSETDARHETEEAQRGRRPTGRTIFLGIVLVILIGYVKMAFDLEWTTQAGRIGPGFFPRVIGILGLVITLGALVNSVRSGMDDEDDEGYVEDEMGEGDLGRHPVPVLLTVVAGAVLLVTLIPLGAIIASFIFLFAMLAFLNPGKWVLNATVSLIVPLTLYLLFQTALNAGLPEGLLPRF